MMEQTEKWHNWCLQLVNEHEKICFLHQTSLSRPTFFISKSRTKLGSWDPGLNMISLSAHLIETQPWDMVLEVLKHEMAHQYVSEKYQNSDHHGPCFLNACKALGVHPAFQTAAAKCQMDITLIKGRLQDDALNTLNKIKKLLALSHSTNEYEARAASQKANNLLAKYNLDKISAKEFDSLKTCYISITHKKKRLDRLQKAISCSLLSFYFVDTVISHTYDAKTNETYRC
ncbi:MAG: DUF2786 domain-containing protein, partial [Desulfobacteraceae bacterium]|nr:DUF2786 domain-containing protein [Desulfobacteraceae bacterium]